MKYYGLADFINKECLYSLKNTFCPDSIFSNDDIGIGLNIHQSPERKVYRAYWGVIRTADLAIVKANIKSNLTGLYQYNSKSVKMLLKKTTDIQKVQAS